MNPPLRQRLAWTQPAQPARGRAEAALASRILAYLFGAGGALVLVALLLPVPEGFNKLAVALLATAALGAAVLLVAAYDRMPLWGHQALLLLATGLVTGGIHYSGMSGGGPYPFFYLWIGVSSFYFFTRKAALVQVAGIALAYGAILALHTPAAVAARLLVTLGSVIVVGLVVGALRERLESLIERLSEAARTDPLTGLLNRRAFRETVEVETERARRSERPVALVILDIDGFNELNRRLGDEAGDAALERVADQLTATKRRIDAAARTYGEEFALVLPDTDAHGAYLLAERLRLALRQALLYNGDRLTASLGVAAFPAHAGSAEQLIHFAEEALGAAKQLGRDRAVLYSPDVARIATDTAERRDAKVEVHVATVVTLAEALDIRDTGTAEHCKAVARYAASIAGELGLPPERVESVRLAGLLHDIGKIGVPDSILGKPAPLVEEEWREMRKHPEIGAHILGSPYFEQIRTWILAHHERPDGTGYPRGLPAFETPLEARILAVADAYEAMTVDRVYRRAIGHEAACRELERCSGSQFDGAVVEAFLAALERDGAPRPGAAARRGGRAARRGARSAPGRSR